MQQKQRIPVSGSVRSFLKKEKTPSRGRQRMFLSLDRNRPLPKNISELYTKISENCAGKGTTAPPFSFYAVFSAERPPAKAAFLLRKTPMFPNVSKQSSTAHLVQNRTRRIRNLTFSSLSANILQNDWTRPMWVRLGRTRFLLFIFKV